MLTRHTQQQKQNHPLSSRLAKHKSLLTVNHLINQLNEHKQKRNFSLRKKQVQLDREQIRKNMKLKWKDPGFSSMEFSKYKALKGKFLNQWQLERIYLATRSYQVPKGFKGFKTANQQKQFPKVPKSMYSQKFKQYIDEIQLKNQDLMFSPKKMRTQISSNNQRSDQNFYKKKIFNGFSTQNKSFGMGTVTWKSKDFSKKYKTLQDYQM